MAGKPSVDRERVAQLAAKGLTSSQIAARLGCSTKTVGKILKEQKEGAK